MFFIKCNSSQFFLCCFVVYTSLSVISYHILKNVEVVLSIRVLGCLGIIYRVCYIVLEKNDLSWISVNLSVNVICYGGWFVSCPVFAWRAPPEKINCLPCLRLAGQKSVNMTCHCLSCFKFCVAGWKAKGKKNTRFSYDVVWFTFCSVNARTQTHAKKKDVSATPKLCRVFALIMSCCTP